MLVAKLTMPVCHQHEGSDEGRESATSWLRKLNESAISVSFLEKCKRNRG